MGKIIFIALIHPIQWTIADLVGADRPAKCQKKTSCVSTGWSVPVLCIRQVAHGIYFLFRQHDAISSFSFGACTVQMDRSIGHAHFLVYGILVVSMSGLV